MATIRLGGLAALLLQAARDADETGVRPGAPLVVRVERMRVDLPVELRVTRLCVAVRLPALREAGAHRFARMRLTMEGGR